MESLSIAYITLNAERHLAESLATTLSSGLSTDLSTGQRTLAYRFPGEDGFQAKGVKHGSWRSNHSVRLVNKTFGRVKPDKVHEYWEANGKAESLRSPVRHYSFDKKSQLIHKKYAKLQALWRTSTKF